MLNTTPLRHAALLVLSALFVIAALPAPGQEPAAEDPPLGKWYMQAINGEVMPGNMSVSIDFRDDGKVYAMEVFEDEPDDSPEVNPYQHDAEQKTITITDAGNEVTFSYRVEDGILTLTGSEGGEQIALELTRNREGAERHQRLRTNPPKRHPVNVGGPSQRARQMQSMTQLQGIHQGLIIYSQGNKEKYPPDLGVLLPGDYVTADYLLAPWSPVEVPEDIDDWTDERKAQWSLEKTSYAYVAGGQKFAGEAEKVVLFELPLYAGTEKIGVCFDDNHTESMSYEEADALIKEQTGKDLMQWMEAMGREQIAWPPAEEPGEDAEAPGPDAEDAKELGDAGPTGTWYIQKDEGRWVPADQEVRLEFRADGTAHIFRNGQPEEGPMRYVVINDRRVIQILQAIDDNRVEIELQYALYDDIMELTLSDDVERGELLLLCRRPQGNAEHQRERAKAQRRDEAGDELEDAGDDVGEAIEGVDD